MMATAGIMALGVFFARAAARDCVSPDEINFVSSVSHVWTRWR
jgi:hypothetical protein